MKQNVGSADRILRMVLGLTIIAWGFISHNWLGAVGLVPLATGFLRWCPAYVPFGISSCKTP